ncbi:MAG: 2OG-Fe(II) oxygenase [Gemmatales bacterium]|nr:2OG-Fe(II) oxygenase [Gemmatales bacterium]MCS7158968.1 2OG-Fe(II) oxygenase [Gemmatales bacterium]MDW8174168.1 2OG-Fe(II) oxygenase [Gemmatales bacterium]MDW8223569.1 2OG-Fe(II) oxygenase [Gemmatales bacterium]
MTCLNLDAFRATRLVTEPFPYLIVPGFVRAEALPAIHADFPPIEQPGSFPLAELTYGPAFQRLIEEMTGPEMCQAFEEKFSLSLRHRPTMITVRGHCRLSDGQIHTDTPSKLLTVLIYLNPQWEADGGRLRLLRSPDSLDEVVVEVPPREGTLLAFRRTDNSWHGHKPYQGPRRVLQMNWMTSHWVMRKEIWRHRLSAFFKRLWRRQVATASVSLSPDY